MAREKYSLLEAIRPQLSEKKYRELKSEIVFKQRMNELNKMARKKDYGARRRRNKRR